MNTWPISRCRRCNAGAASWPPYLLNLRLIQSNNRSALTSLFSLIIFKGLIWNSWFLISLTFSCMLPPLILPYRVEVQNMDHFYDFIMLESFIKLWEWPVRYSKCLIFLSDSWQSFLFGCDSMNQTFLISDLQRRSFWAALTPGFSCFKQAFFGGHRSRDAGHVYCCCFSHLCVFRGDL